MELNLLCLKVSVVLIVLFAVVLHLASRRPSPRRRLHKNPDIAPQRAPKSVQRTSRPSEGPVRLAKVIRLADHRKQVS